MQKQIPKQPKARQLPSGSWRCEPQVNGVRKSFIETTEDEAVRKGYIWLLQNGTNDAAKEKLKTVLTLTEAIDGYIENKSNLLSPSTIRGYRGIQRNRFQSVMNTQISDVNWQSVVNAESKRQCTKKYKGKTKILDKTLSPTTVKKAWGFVRSVLVFYGLQVPKITLPRSDNEEHPSLDPEQIQIFLNLIKGTKYELNWLILLHGLRRSEILALKKSSIITKDERVYIRVAASKVYDENWTLVEKRQTKTKDSNRTVPVMIPRLIELVNNCEDGNLCTASPNSLYRPLQKILDGNGLPNVGLHGLRHSFASLCYHLHIPELVVQKWGGWSDPQTVRRIYTHLSNQDEEESIAKMESFFQSNS